jgi:hypothetical protein
VFDSPDRDERLAVFAEDAFDFVERPEASVASRQVVEGRYAENEVGARVAER